MKEIILPQKENKPLFFYAILINEQTKEESLCKLIINTDSDFDDFYFMNKAYQIQKNEGESIAKENYFHFNEKIISEKSYLETENNEQIKYTTRMIQRKFPASFTLNLINQYAYKNLQNANSEVFINTKDIIYSFNQQNIYYFLNQKEHQRKKSDYNANQGGSFADFPVRKKEKILINYLDISNENLESLSENNFLDKILINRLPDYYFFQNSSLQSQNYIKFDTFKTPIISIGIKALKELNIFIGKDEYNFRNNNLLTNDVYQLKISVQKDYYFENFNTKLLYQNKKYCTFKGDHAHVNTIDNNKGQFQGWFLELKIFWQYYNDSKNFKTNPLTCLINLLGWECAYDYLWKDNHFWEKANYNYFPTKKLAFFCRDNKKNMPIDYTKEQYKCMVGEAWNDRADITFDKTTHVPTIKFDKYFSIGRKILNNFDIYIRNNLITNADSNNSPLILVRKYKDNYR